MGFFGFLLNSLGTLAIDTVAALINGPPPTVAKVLKDKSFKSNAYGNPIIRCRGLVRNQGMYWWMTQIQTSWWKTTSGGIFGIGQKSVYVPYYSVSMLIGFGEKLGGGAATRCNRLWLDGKLLYNGVPSTATITGTITVSVLVGGQPAGQNYILVDLAIGATLTLNPGDLIQIPGDPGFTYQVQQTISVTGPLLQAPISIFPALRVSITGGGALTVVGVNSPVWDLSSFDPNPHDGSHFDSGYNCPPGGVRFYYGSDTDQPDPTIEAWMGKGHVPGYTGRVKILIHDLQLKNYGNHPPQPSAEWAYDAATGAFPSLGPIADVNGNPVELGSSSDSIVIPYDGPGANDFFNPYTQTLLRVWVQTTKNAPTFFGGNWLLTYQIDSQRNLSLGVVCTSQSTPTAIIADNEGFIYFCAQDVLGGPVPTPANGGTGEYGVNAPGLPLWVLFKVDGQSGEVVNFYGLARINNAGGSPCGFNWYPGHGQVLNSLGSCSDEQSNFGDPVGCYLWDGVASFFGNPFVFQCIAVIENFGGISILDRNSMLKYGSPDPTGVNVQSVVKGYDKNGNPLAASGTITSDLSTPFGGMSAQIAGDQMCSDANGNLYMCQHAVVRVYQLILSITVDPNTLQPYMAVGFNTVDINISSIGSDCALRYNQSSNTVMVIGTSNVGLIDCNTLNITSVTAVAVGGGSPSPYIDIMGTLLFGSSADYSRFDAAALQVTNTYVLNGGNFFPGATTIGATAYDPLTDSMWAVVASPTGLGYNSFYRLFLDRGNGSGVGLDSIVSSLMLDAGYLSSEFDVTQLTTSGISVGGIEFERESFLDSLKRLMQLYLFDAAEIDGKIVFVPRGQAPVLTIQESDLGVVSEPQQYEPRLIETVQDELDTPESVWVRYYDTLKEDQQAVQYSKRISAAYASSLINAKPVTHTKQRLDITSPVTDGASPIKIQTDKILWDIWAGRPQRKAKLPFGGSSTAAYWRLDPTDVVDINFESQVLETRLEEADLGASLALEITGRNQDRTVYSNTNIPSGSAGVPSGGGPIGGIQTPNGKSNYTISPTYPLSSPNSTTIDVAAFTASFADGTRTSYAARTITVPDPGSGNSAIYYVTIYDPTFQGEPGGVATLSVFDNVNSASAFVGVDGYIFAGAVTVLGAGATTTTPNPIPGGQPPQSSGGNLVGEVPFTSTRGDFKVAHGLPQTPANVQIQITTPGDVILQVIRYDAAYVYLEASADGITGYLELFL